MVPSKLEYVTISGTLDSKENIYTNEQFVATGNNTTNTNPILNNYVGTVNGGKDLQLTASLARLISREPLKKETTGLQDGQSRAEVQQKQNRKYCKVTLQLTRHLPKDRLII